MGARPRSMRCVIALSLVAAAYAPARAQGACTGCDSTRSHVFPMVGLRVGTPQKVSAAVGIVVGMEWQKYGADRSRDIALFVEPGVGAGRASVAFIKGIGSMGSGYGVAATVLRTWKQPWSITPNTTYVGGEVLIMPLFLTGPRVGLMRRITGPSKGSWFLVGDFGVGL
jgi:hypothetical protein